MLIKTVDDYLSLPYTIEVIQDKAENGEVSWFAQVVELPGCMTEADSFAELGQMIEDAMRSWFEIALENGHAIPDLPPA